MRTRSGIATQGRARYCLHAYGYRTEYRACHPHVPSTVPVPLFRPCVPVQGMATRILPAYLASMRLVMHALLICIASLPNLRYRARGGEGPGEVPSGARSIGRSGKKDPDMTGFGEATRVCLAWPCHAMSCHAMSCHAMSCHADATRRDRI